VETCERALYGWWEEETFAMRRTRSRARSIARLAPVGNVEAFVRYLRDPDASLLGKVLVLATVAYVVLPVDAIPDLIPAIGWLDDLGVVGVALAYVARVLARYRDR
jgi:uncharacterized membrane protein YkvA (DUF1232 family)